MTQVTRIFIFIAGLVAAGVAIVLVLDIVPLEAAQEMVARGEGVVGIVFLVMLLGTLLFKDSK